MPVPLSSVGRGTYTTPGQPVAGGGDWFTQQGAPTGSAGIMAPRQTAEDQRLLQDPTFRAQYDAWVMAQGPGAADWATPTSFQQQRGGGQAPPPGGASPLDQYRSNPQAMQEIQRLTGMSLESAQEILAGQGGPGLQAEMTRRLTQAGLLAPGTAPPAGPPAPGGASGGGRMSNADAQAFFDRLFPGGTVTPQDLEAHRGELEGAGFTLNPNAGGLITDLTLPSGDTVDPIYGAGSGENRKQWIVHARGEGGGGAGFLGLDPTAAYRLGHAGLTMDPGYQFRLQEGQKALEHSAAAKGTLLTGGTLKGLARYGQDYASGEFQNRYNRLFGEQVNRYNQLSGLAGFGANAAAGQAGANSQYANQAGDLTTQRGNAQAAGTVGQANAVNQAIGGATNLAQMYYLSRLYGGGGAGAGGGGGAYIPPWAPPGAQGPFR